MSRPSALHRLYRAKFTLLATVSFFLGLGLLFGAHWAENQPAWAWAANLPLIEIGSGLLVGGLFGVLFQYIGQRDAEELSSERFRRIITEEAPAIRKAVVDGFALEPEELSKVAAPATLDKVITNSLAIRLGDKAFAADIYTDLREQAIGASERHRDTDVSVSLTPWKEGPASGKGSMFVATIRWEYKVRPEKTTMRFVCTSDLDDYRDELRAGNDLTWYFESVGQLSGASKEAFELIEVAIDGQRTPARRTTRAGSQHYTVNMEPELIGKSEATVTFTCRVLVQRHGHLLHLDVACPTKGLKVSFSYGGCGIRHVNVLDYIASARQPRLTVLPASEPTPSIQVGFDGWVWPKAGVGFVWVLHEEMG